jgi:hypothetical protein
VRSLHLLIGCPLIAMIFPFVADLFVTGHEAGQHPLVPALLVLGGPFVLAILAAALAQPLLSLQPKACMVFLSGVAFAVGYTLSMNHVRRDGPGNLAPLEVFLMTVCATVSLSVGAFVGTLASWARRRRVAGSGGA